MGDEPDADQRLDAPFQAFGPLARGRRSGADGAGLSKSATSRRFVALSAARMKAWMETRLDDLDLLVIQIDGIHMDEDMLLVAAIGVDADGRQASARPRRGRDGKRDDGAGAHRQSHRAWARSSRAASVHHRWFEGAVQGDPAHLRTRYGDPALPDSQGAQHSGAVAEIDARLGEKRLAAGLGNGRRRRRPKSCFAISPAVSKPTGTAFPLRSWKGSTRCSPSRGSAFPANCAARSPARTSSRMSWARCEGSAETSNTGARPRWRCAGPPPPCRRPRRASVD